MEHERISLGKLKKRRAGDVRHSTAPRIYRDVRLWSLSHLCVSKSGQFLGDLGGTL